MNFFGYLDPGSSTLIIQAVLGGAAGVAVLFKTMGNKFSRKKKTDDGAPEGEEAGTDSQDATTPESNAHPPTSD
jgi:hypothetical protein